MASCQNDGVGFLYVLCFFLPSPTYSLNLIFKILLLPKIIGIFPDVFALQEPIIHGNLTCDTIFIQHNGLVKIGSVAPDAIHKNVKTFRENIKNFHFLAPEWAGNFIIDKYASILPLIMLLN